MITKRRINLRSASENSSGSVMSNHVALVNNEIAIFCSGYRVNNSYNATFKKEIQQKFAFKVNARRRKATSC
jgi:hypothetical protein